MRSLHLAKGKLSLRENQPTPEPGPGESLVRVQQAGICATDLALARGYMDFAGVPGHEFVGYAETGPFAGQRVVGEINLACGTCPTCTPSMPGHCPRRRVLGIAGQPGAFAEYLLLPDANLHLVSAEVSDDAAVFTEPLAAAFEIPAQIALEPGMPALVAGDGKLGLLCAQVLAEAGLQVTIAGRHPERRRLLSSTIQHHSDLLEADSPPLEARFGLAVEASGSPEVLARLLPGMLPRGRIILKTTMERSHEIDLAPLVINEISLLGSRCGPFDEALRALATGRMQVEGMIEARYALADAEQAFAHAGRAGSLKVLLDM
ncbi:MAG: alcohol dehydrogenase catalytic domain-containing protein [Planctomycetota bacterium]|jgi:threonine dehydrogenase-like Zn-dependent dehydrogenase